MPVNILPALPNSNLLCDVRAVCLPSAILSQWARVAKMLDIRVPSWFGGDMFSCLWLKYISRLYSSGCIPTFWLLTQLNFDSFHFWLFAQLYIWTESQEYIYILFTKKLYFEPIDIAWIFCCLFWLCPLSLSWWWDSVSIFCALIMLMMTMMIFLNMILSIQNIMKVLDNCTFCSKFCARNISEFCLSLHKCFELIPSHASLGSLLCPGL